MSWAQVVKQNVVTVPVPVVVPYMPAGTKIIDDTDMTVPSTTAEDPMVVKYKFPLYTADWYNRDCAILTAFINNLCSDMLDTDSLTKDQEAYYTLLHTAQSTHRCADMGMLILRTAEIFAEVMEETHSHDSILVNMEGLLPVLHTSMIRVVLDKDLDRVALCGHRWVALFGSKIFPNVATALRYKDIPKAKRMSWSLATNSRIMKWSQNRLKK